MITAPVSDDEIRSELERVADAFEREQGSAIASAAIATLGLTLIKFSDNPSVAAFIAPNLFIGRDQFDPAARHAITLSMIIAKRVL